MQGETAPPTIPTKGLNRSQALSRGHALALPAQRKSPSSPALEAVMMKLLQQHKQPLLNPAMPPPACSTLQVIAGAPGDGGHPPAAPLPPHLAPRLAPLLALPLVHGVPDVVVGEEMVGDPGADHDRDGVPDLTQEVEEETELLHRGGDVTGHDHGQTTETESETETGSGKGTGNGTGIGTGDDNQRAGEQGPVPAHGRGAAIGEEGEAAEATDGEIATAAVPLSPQNAQTTVPLLATEEPGSLSSASVTS